MLQLFNIRKSYTTASFTQVALDDVSVAFRDNEFVAILGPSGSGKTTMLNIIGGLDHYDSGNLVIDGIATKEYKARDWDTYRNNRIGFVFQSYNLIPHQTVLANVELALTLSGVSRRERRARAKEALRKVGLADHINKKPNQLSGGQMQRVAVARALINDPEILLADEPTGALDSVTSVQIMDLLTDIAKDRLVIMVTHNPELADTYANRIVNLRDGKIVDDSNPFQVSPQDKKKSKKPVRRTSMSFFTAIALSFNNLLTKKGRTIMTAFAGSIGIIGIAAILALANGVNNYIQNVEEDTLTVYPLTIQSTGFDITSMISSMMSVSSSNSNSNKNASTTDDGKVSETKTLANMLSHVGTNDLASLKTYLDSDASGIKPYVNMIAYNYSITPLIFASDTSDGVRQVNPSTAFSALNRSSLSGAAGNYASMLSSGNSTSSFSQMLNNPSMLSSQYDVVAGRWPDNYDECVLVLNDDGSVSDLTLYAMGLRDPAELSNMISQLADNKTVDTPTNKLEFTYDQLMAVTFKLVNYSDTYVKDTTQNVWVSKLDDADFMKNLVANAEDLKIVGIVQPNPDAQATSLSPGICYRSDLQLHLIDEANKSQIVKDQLDKPDVDVFTGRTFEDEQANPDRQTLDFSSMITVDTSKIEQAFNFDPSALSLDLSGLSSLSNLSLDPSTLPATPQLDLNVLLQQLSTMNVDITQQDVIDLITFTMNDFLSTYPIDPTSPTFDPNELVTDFTDYLNDPDVQAKLLAELGTVIDTDALMQQVQQVLQNYMVGIMQTYMSAIMSSITQQLTAALSSAMSQLAENMSSAMHIDQQAFMDAFQFNMSQKDLQDLLMSFMTTTQASYATNLKSLGYADLAVPTSISIYPKDFTSKGQVINILDGYNNNMSDTGQDDKVITYTDIVGTLMSSVTSIVNMVSYVLVAFVAISLVVSSIMIGIITYISVLERKKEIGILRSIGASKGDIGRVFNAETLIVGFIAGLIGVVATLLACIPANIIVYNMFDVPNVASLPWNAALILIGISMVLSFIAGLIPSSAASRRDPVEALRSE